MLFLQKRQEKPLYLSILLIFSLISPSLAKKKVFKFDRNTEKPEEVIAKYVRFHKKTCDHNIPCKNRPFVLFKPRAGLGDSSNAMYAALERALIAGLAFYIDWKFFDPALTFNWKEVHGYTYKLKNCDIMKVCEPRFEISGHVTADNPVIGAKVVNELQQSFEAEILWRKHLLGPSPPLQELIDTTLAKFPNGICDAAFHIRTGNDDYNQFLAPGDEVKFVQCLANAPDRMKSVFVASDDATVKSKTVAALTTQNYNVHSLPDSIIHIATAKSGENEKILKTFLEFHMIARCKANFLTSSSLFGSVASELLGQKPVYVISHKFCDDKDRMEKFSYVMCAEPKYPEFCVHEADAMSLGFHDEL